MPVTGARSRGVLPSWLPTIGLMHLVWLTYLGFQPVQDPSSGLFDWAVVVVAILIYLPIHVTSYHPSGTLRRRALVATVVLGVLVSLVNASGTIFFIYAAAQAAYQHGPTIVRWLAGLTALSVLVTAVSFVPLPYRLYGAIPTTILMWVIGLQTAAEIRRDTAAERIRIDNVRIEQLATAAERERIARDLHDLLGQSLSSLVVRAQLVQSMIAVDPESAVSHAADLEEGARDTLRQVREAVGGLSQVSLSEEIGTANATLRAAGLDVQVHIPHDAIPNPLVERSLALALRESTTNVIRHAQASSCRIELAHEDGLWRLQIVDNGVGGDFAEGNGLRGMRERITAIGGRVEREAGRGTRVTVTVPA